MSMFHAHGSILKKQATFRNGAKRRMVFIYIYIYIHVYMYMSSSLLYHIFPVYTYTSLDMFLYFLQHLVGGCPCTRDLPLPHFLSKSLHQWVTRSLASQRPSTSKTQTQLAYIVSSLINMPFCLLLADSCFDECLTCCLNQDIPCRLGLRLAIILI